jgi:hypothetical protein
MPLALATGKPSHQVRTAARLTKGQVHAHPRYRGQSTHQDAGPRWISCKDNNTRRRDRLITELQGMGYHVSLEKAAS